MTRKSSNMGATGSTPTPSTLDLVSRPARCPETGRPQGVALPGFVWDRKDCTALTLLPVSLVIKLTGLQLRSRAYAAAADPRRSTADQPRRGPAAERVR